VVAELYGAHLDVKIMGSSFQLPCSKADNYKLTVNNSFATWMPKPVAVLSVLR